MTIDEVQKWCCDNSIDARMILRGNDCMLRHDQAESQISCPPFGEIFYWELFIRGKGYPSSPSDTERLVTGKLTVEEFLAEVRRH